MKVADGGKVKEKGGRKGGKGKRRRYKKGKGEEKERGNPASPKADYDARKRLQVS